MSIFQTVKEHVTARDAAEFYGVHVTRSGLAKCPFHNDKNPSLKLDRRYYCFGCHATGDVIDFVANYFHLGMFEAAQKIARDFGIRTDVHTEQAKPRHIPVRNKPEHKPVSPYIKGADPEADILMEYIELLAYWEKKYAPADPDAELHPLFVEAITHKEIARQLLDERLAGYRCIDPDGKEYKRIEGFLVRFYGGKTERN